MNILAKLAGLNNLTTNEKVLVDYILANPKQMITSRPTELATEAYVSVATIYRLINKLGLNGIGELKVEVASSLRSLGEGEEIDYDYPILETDTPFQIMQNLSRIYTHAIDETVSFADPEQLVQVGQALLKAKVIDVYAASANLFFAQNFKFQMQEIGVLINVPEEDYMQRLSAANSNQDHVAVVVSYGGRGQTVKEVVKILDKNNIEIILITSTQDNPLAQHATHKVYLASAENHYNKVSSFATRVSLLSVFDTLYSIYFNANYEGNLNYKIANYQKMNRKLE